MTGPEHYAEAERILVAVDAARRSADGRLVDPVMAMQWQASLASEIAAAQVHATLALAAATALSTTEGTMAPETNHARDWRKVLLP